MKESGLFPLENIIAISNTDHIYTAKNASLYLVFWDDWKDNDEINDIIDTKMSGTPLIVYAPPRSGITQDQRSIPKETMRTLSQESNTIVTNLPGRLLNDIMISLITGSYGK